MSEYDDLPMSRGEYEEPDELSLPPLLPPALLSPPIVLTEEQSLAISSILSWFNSPPNLRHFEFKLGGYAGTGKTTIIKTIINEIPGAALCAFTGKAVSVLHRKGCLNATTIHSLIYYTEVTKSGMIHRLRHKEEILELGIDLIIVDEASMISRELYDGLTSYKIPILWVGDPGQLEPVGDDVELMSCPDIVLNKIHRQAENSEIIKFATELRKSTNPLIYLHRENDKSQLEVVLSSRAKHLPLYCADQIICGFNKTRVIVNSYVREHKLRQHELIANGFENRVHLKERIICLSNSSDYNIFNGMIMTVQSVIEHRNPDFLTIVAEDDLGSSRTFLARLAQFGQQKVLDLYEHRKLEKQLGLKLALVDYGYCITAHKSQGSEWDHVLVIEEFISRLWSGSRWRYTAATRASKKLTYVVK